MQYGLSNLPLIPCQDLGYLLPEAYDRAWNATLAAAPLLPSIHDARTARGAARVQYDSEDEFHLIGHHLSMLQEWKVAAHLSCWSLEPVDLVVSSVSAAVSPQEQLCRVR